MDTRENFIPLRKADLVEGLASDRSFGADEQQQFLQLCRVLEATFHFEYHERLEALKNSYVAYDPDAPVATRAGPRMAQPGDVDPLFDKVLHLLVRANYRRLDRDAISQAVAVTSQWGVRLEVDFSAFDRLEVFTRGNYESRRTFRDWRMFFGSRSVKVPTYRRLVILFRLNDESDAETLQTARPVFIKMFKEIPHTDLETLMPGTRVKMTWFDQGRIFLPAVSGAAVTIYKAIKGALVLAFAGVYGVIAFLGLVGAMIGYGVKSFFGYLRARDKYHLSLTKNLYFQNLDNNAGVLFRMLDEAEEQEFCEAVLAYFLLWRQAPPGGWSVAELDRRAEDYLKHATGIDVDFEIGDALDKLKRLQLVNVSQNNTVHAVSLETALQRLDTAWDGFFQFASHGNDSAGDDRHTEPPRPSSHAA